jgi:hypothetical protein
VWWHTKAPSEASPGGSGGFPPRKKAYMNDFVSPLIPVTDRRNRVVAHEGPERSGGLPVQPNRFNRQIRLYDVNISSHRARLKFTAYVENCIYIGAFD